MPSFRPLEDRILIKQREAKAQKGMLVIPEKYKHKPRVATVIAVGPGERLEDGTRRPCIVQPGDLILFPAYATQELLFDEEPYLLMKDRDALGVIDDADEYEKADVGASY